MRLAGDEKGFAFEEIDEENNRLRLNLGAAKDAIRFRAANTEPRRPMLRPTLFHVVITPSVSLGLSFGGEVCVCTYQLAWRLPPVHRRHRRVSAMKACNWIIRGAKRICQGKHFHRGCGETKRQELEPTTADMDSPDQLEHVLLVVEPIAQEAKTVAEVKAAEYAVNNLGNFSVWTPG